MDLFERETAWWTSLSSLQRRAATAVIDAVPDWMVHSLADHNIEAVEADLTGHSHVFLMPTHLRDFLSEQPVATDQNADTPHDTILSPGTTANHNIP